LRQPQAGQPEGYPTLIGEDVLIGHMAMVHGCTLHDRAFVGLGTIVMDGAVIESDAMLAAGAMLTPGKRIPARQLWSGRPAAFMRELTDAALAEMQRGVAHYVDNGAGPCRCRGAGAVARPKLNCRRPRPCAPGRWREPAGRARHARRAGRRRGDRSRAGCR
jgi:hypothetical protein